MCFRVWLELFPTESIHVTGGLNLCILPPLNILGLSAFYHDSAACLVQDGRIVGAAQEERFTRKKHDAAFPKNAIEYCLKEGGITLAQVDYVAFYEKPFVKFDRILHSYLAYAPSGAGGWEAAAGGEREAW